MVQPGKLLEGFVGDAAACLAGSAGSAAVHEMVVLGCLPASHNHLQATKLPEEEP